MEIGYKVLWIDDQPQNVQGMENEMKTFFEKEGFRWECTKLASVEAVRDWLSRYRSNEVLDLVLLDWQLGDASGDTGESLAPDIRAKLAHCDLVFYSSVNNQSLHELIAKKRVDGVFCCPRRELAGFVQERLQFQLTRLGIAGLRGQIISAGAQIEMLISTLLSRLATVRDFESAIQSKVEEKLKKRETDAQTLLIRWKNREITEFQTTWFDSVAQTDTLVSLLKRPPVHLDHAAVQHLRDLCIWYSSHGVHLRNDLAHSLVQQEGEVVRSPKREYNASSLRDARSKLNALMQALREFDSIQTGTEDDQ